MPNQTLYRQCSENGCHFPHVLRTPSGEWRADTISFVIRQMSAYAPMFLELEALEHYVWLVQGGFEFLESHPNGLRKEELRGQIIQDAAEFYQDEDLFGRFLEEMDSQGYFIGLVNECLRLAGALLLGEEPVVVEGELGRTDITTNGHGNGKNGYGKELRQGVREETDTSLVRVALIGGDIGPIRDMLVIAQKLEGLTERRIKADWFVDPSGQGINFLKQQGISFETRPPFPEDRSRYSVILCGTSTKAFGLQLIWTSFARLRHVYCVWYEDLYCNSIRKEVLAGNPNEILLLDGLAAGIVARRRRRVQKTIVGKLSAIAVPQPTALSGIRSAVRGRLGISEGDFLTVFGFAGEPADHAEKQLDGIASIQDRFGPEVVCALRFHPANPKKDELWERAQTLRCRTIDATRENLDQLYYGSDLVIAHYLSGDAVKVVLAGVPIGTMLFPDDRVERIQLGYPDGVPPILLPDPSWGINGPEGVLALINRVLTEGPRASEHTRTVRAAPFRSWLEPGGTERAVQAILQRIRQ